ncbi:response regulator [Fulvimonas yonginensis]|uniref:Response regulator n=1 Tax=Fulvimonas yonginensis TaxID=1495200 RepID=A0ABU8JCL8_9GAMM
MSNVEVDGKILIASDQRAEAEALRSQLAADYPNITVSFDPDRYVEDFERVRPDVLLLVFNRIENAQSYYLGLYRFGATAQQHSHRTIVFCTREQVKTAFDLCRKQYFDDYVLFWPSPYDGSRLPMSIHVALRELKQSRGMSFSERQLGDYARQLDEFGRTLDQHLTQGGRQVESAAEQLARNGERLGAAIEQLLGRISRGELSDAMAVRDVQKLEKEFKAFVSAEIGPLVESGRVAIEPLRRWTSQLQRESSSQLGQAQTLLRQVAGPSRRVLVVDDDEFSQKVVARILEREGYEVVLAGSGTEALNLLRKIRPSLILMDYMLPDQDGVETTRRLKQPGEFDTIPIIMLTGQSDRETVIRSLAAGAVDFLAKPINPGALLTKLAKYLGG